MISLAKPDERNSQSQGKRQEYTAYDRALVAAAQEGVQVRFTQVDGEITSGKVVSVDRFNIEVELEAAPYTATKIWLSKVTIARTLIGTK